MPEVIGVEVNTVFIAHMQFYRKADRAWGFLLSVHYVESIEKNIIHVFPFINSFDSYKNSMECVLFSLSPSLYKCRTRGSV